MTTLATILLTITWILAVLAFIGLGVAGVRWLRRR